MIIKQISVFVENKLGRLSEITRFLGENKIDIRAVSIADTVDFGILRLIVNDPDRAEQLLREAEYTVAITSVIAVELKDSPGALADVMDVLAKNAIDVEYMYAFITRKEDGAYVLIRVTDNDKAIAALQAADIRLATSDMIYMV